MGGFIVLLQVFLVIVTIVSLISHYGNKGKRRQEAKEIYDIAKEQDAIEKLDEKDFENIKKVYNIKKEIKNEVIEIVGAYNEEILRTHGKGGTSEVRDKYIGNFLIKVPDHAIINPLEIHRAKGIYDGKYFYLSELDGESFLEYANKVEGLEFIRETGKEEGILFETYMRMFFIVPFMLLFSFIPFWKEIPLAYNIIFGALVLFMIIPLKKKSEKIYALKGQYGVDEMGQPLVAGIKVNGLRGKLTGDTYEIGEEVEVEGYKVFNNSSLILTRYKGFSLYEELGRFRRWKLITCSIIIALFCGLVYYVVHSSELEKYLKYQQIKEMPVEYHNTSKLRDEVVPGQYIEIEEAKLYPVKPLKEKYGLGDYYFVEEGKGRGALEKYRDRIAEAKQKEDKIKNFTSIIDYNLTYGNDESYREVESYKKLKTLYFDQGTSQTELKNAYYDFLDEIYEGINKDIEELQKLIAEEVKSGFILDSYSAGSNTGYYDYNNDNTNVYLAVEPKEKYISGIVTKVEEKDGVKSIGIDTYSNYKDVNKAKIYFVTIGLYIMVMLYMLGIILKEAIRVRKFK